MKRSLFLLLLFIASTASVLAADDPSVALVKQLYREFAWEAVLTDPDPAMVGFMDQPRSELERFLTTKLAAELRRDREEVARTGEVGRLDFLPLWDSQDPSFVEVQIRPGPEPQTVLVTLASPHSEAPRKLTFRLKRTPAGLRIADIKYTSGLSLTEVLSANP
jgi:hypothetical protein